MARERWFAVGQSEEQPERVENTALGSKTETDDEHGGSEQIDTRK